MSAIVPYSRPVVAKSDEFVYRGEAWRAEARPFEDGSIFDPQDPDGEHFGLFDRAAEEWPGGAA